MSSEPKTSYTLLGRALAGQQDAWERIVEIYGPVIRRQCERKGVPPSHLDDIGQEIFISIYKSLSRFESGRVGLSFIRWTRRITSRRIADFYEQQPPEVAKGGTDARKLLVEVEEPAVSRQVTASDDGDSIDWPMARMQQDLYAHVIRFIAEGSTACRIHRTTLEAVRLKDVEGLSYRQIAELVSMPEATVKSKVRRGRTKIKALFGDLLDDLQCDPAQLSIGRGTDSNDD